jgi:glycerol kinase
LPQVKACDQIYGMLDEPELFPEKLPIAGVIGDSQAALFGQQCTEPGMAKGTYGTGTSVLMYVGSEPLKAGNGLVSAIAWGLDGKVHYALEAIIHSTGDCLNWVKEQLGLFETYEELEREIASIKDSGGVYLVPAFVGLGAPHWNPRARAAIVGMNRASGRKHIMRAAVESIAFQVNDAVKLLERETSKKLKELRVDGGATANAQLMQFQADLLAAEVVCSDAAELSALGSAYMGGLALGWWESAETLQGFYKKERVYKHHMKQQQRSKLQHGWQAAVTGILAADEALNREEIKYE